MYNELRGSGAHFMFRYALNGLGFAAFEAGTTLVAKNDKSCLDNAGWLAIALSASIFATTIYAQDFRDIVGDSLINRDTIPLRFGSSSRTALLLGVVTSLGVYAGGRFVKYTTVDEDRNSYLYGYLWCTFFPAIGVYFAQPDEFLIV
ncbi:hypothetical protein B0H14DRAFT_3727533 [Mycena olivaceomarginata]|nr:hypothetical protein B0H14DRAFT_3727533 [Mycena olivaceomarginata]